MKKQIFQKTTYYAKDNSGSLRFWSIEGYVDEMDGVPFGRLEMEHGQVGGESIYNFENVPYGLANRSINEQVLLRVESRINKKIQAGYQTDIEAAKNNKRVNKLGLSRVMLAKKFEGMSRKIDYSKPTFIQPKFNGYRCATHSDPFSENITPYSRNGLPMTNIGHIIESLRGLDLPTIDGELYHHGTKFQVISSWIKKKQPESKHIVYMVYDVMLPLPYSERYAFLKNLDYVWNDKIILSPTYQVSCQEQAIEYFRDFRKSGYEGAILRTDDAVVYEDGKRSNSLIKMKEWFDDEFLIIDIVPSAEGWGRLVCLAKNGRTFMASAPGTREEKIKMLVEKEKYIGQYANVEYAELTNAGLPFHGVATGIRNKPLE